MRGIHTMVSYIAAYLKFVHSAYSGDNQAADFIITLNVPGMLGAFIAA